MSKVYIVTEEGKEYTTDGINHILSRIRNDHNDQSKIDITQGTLINNPKVLMKFLSEDPGHTYVFVSHNKGIDLIHTKDDIRAFMELLRNTKNKTSWEILMEAIKTA